MSRNLLTMLHKLKRLLIKQPNSNPRKHDPRYSSNIIGTRVNLGAALLQGNCSIQDNVVLKGTVTIGKYTTIGRESILHGGSITIGNYCQLAPRVAIYSVNHPMQFLTTYVNQRLFNGELSSLVQDQPIKIGNDVWIGYGAIVLPGVEIGNGAIIGAGAVVTKNIDSYGIAVGNPARVVKRRFDSDVANLLNEWQWWNLDPAGLEKYKPLFMCNIPNATEEFKLSLMDAIKEKASRSK